LITVSSHGPGLGKLISPCPHDVDDLDAALITGAGVEQLLFSGAHGAPLELLFDNLKAFFYGSELVEMLHLAGGGWCGGHGNTSN